MAGDAISCHRAPAGASSPLAAPTGTTHGMVAGAFIKEHGLAGLRIVLHGECQGGLYGDTAGPWLGGPVTRSEQPVIYELFPHLLETPE